MKKVKHVLDLVEYDAIVYAPPSFSIKPVGVNGFTVIIIALCKLEIVILLQGWMTEGILGDFGRNVCFCLAFPSVHASRLPMNLIR